MVNRIFTLEEGQRQIFPHTYISVGKGKRAIYIDRYESYIVLPYKVQSNALIQIDVEEDAELIYVNIQRWPAGVYHFSNQNARIKGNGRFISVYVALGASVDIASLQSYILGPSARSEMFGIILASGAQYFDFHTLQDHSSNNGLSDQLFNTAVGDEARANFLGLIRVHKNAQKTDAYQANRNILLSKDAKVNSTPKLEIEADDVRCTHGVSTATLDEEQLFYLATRGLSNKDAESLLIAGFFEQVLDRIPEEGVKIDLREQISNQISKLIC